MQFNKSFKLSPRAPAEPRAAADPKAAADLEKAPESEITAASGDTAKPAGRQGSKESTSSARKPAGRQGSKESTSSVRSKASWVSPTSWLRCLGGSQRLKDDVASPEESEGTPSPQGRPGGDSEAASSPRAPSEDLKTGGGESNAHAPSQQTDPKESDNVYDGRWMNSQGYELMLEGQTVVVQTGEAATFTALSGKKCTLEAFGVITEGGMTEDGRILWADGDAWVRLPPGNIPSPANPPRRGVSKESVGLAKGFKFGRPRSFSGSSFGSRGGSARGRVDPAAVARLRELFPSWDTGTLRDVLANTGGDVQAAQRTLQDMSLGTGAEGHPREPRRTPRDRRRASREQREILDALDVQAPTVAPRKLYDKAIAARIRDHCGEQAQELKPVAAISERQLVEEPSGSSSREDVIAASLECLRKRCESLGMQQVEMSDDGNCQFRAISQELFGVQRHHTTVRAEVVSHMAQYASSYQQFFPDGEWERYLDDMGKLRAWGDELTLRAAAETFGVRIHLITSSKKGWYLVYDPVAGIGRDARELFITYVAPIHYNTMEPVS